MKTFSKKIILSIGTAATLFNFAGCSTSSHLMVGRQPAMAKRKPTSTTSRVVIAAIMQNEETPIKSGGYRMWNNGGHNPDTVTDASTQRHDIASLYYPTIGLYDVSDPDYIEYECQLLKMAGIDVASIYFPRANDSDQIRNVKLLLPRLSFYGLHAFARTMVDNPVDAATIFDIFRQSPAQWYIGNQPVFSWFTFPILPNQVADFKSRYQPAPIVWRWLSGNHVDAPWKRILDGAYDWVGFDSNYNSEPAEAPYIGNYSFENEVAGWSKDLSRANVLISSGALSQYILGVSPGFDDQPVNGWGKGPRKIDRADGKTYEYKWQQATVSHYSWVMIPTFDDWSEGTLIHPTVEFGNQYLSLTQKYAAQFKGEPLNKANLNLPEWIYRLRKATSDEKTLSILDQAGALIAKEAYSDAENLIAPLASTYNFKTNR